MVLKGKQQGVASKQLKGVGVIKRVPPGGQCDIPKVTLNHDALICAQLSVPLAKCFAKSAKKACVPSLPVKTGNQNAEGSQEMVVNAPNTIVKQPLDPRHVPADSGQAHLSGAQTEEAAVRKRQKGNGAGAVHRESACVRHKRQSGYPQVFEEDAKHKKRSDNVVAVQGIGVVSNRNLTRFWY